MMDSSQSREMSLGQILVEARKRQGVTLEQVAEQLNIQLDKLRALEEDNYDKLFSPVFVRGYIRSYAKLLNVDSEPLVARYNEQYQQEEAPLPQVESINETMRVKPPTWPSRLLLISVIVLLWALAYWYFGDDPAPPAKTEAVQSQAADPSSAQRQETDPGEYEQAASSAAAVQAEASASSDLPGAVETLARAGQAQSLAASAAGNDTDETDKASPDHLQLRFANDCWVDITDATGKKLIAALQKANSELTLTGSSPFSITLGNAEGVEVRLNRLPVKVPEAGPGKVVHFTAVASP